MQFFLTRLGVTAVVLLWTFSASAAGLLPVSQVFVFGDSLSDTGNAYSATGNTYPPSPPNYMGRLSNGLFWIESFGSGLGVSVTNYAFAGAQTGTANVNSGDYPILDDTGALSQVGQFQAGLGGPADASALYVVFAGSNNWCQACFNPITDNPADVVNAGVTDLVTAVMTLNSLGAQKFMVFGLPDLGLTPRAALAEQVFPGAQALLSQITDGWNSTLLSNLPALPGLEFFDTAGVLRDVVADPGAFGFSNVTDACQLVPACATGTLETQDGYLFWDDIHPTRATHALLADLALAQVVPVPPAFLLFASALGLLSWTRRRLRA